MLAKDETTWSFWLIENSQQQASSISSSTHIDLKIQSMPGTSCLNTFRCVQMDLVLDTLLKLKMEQTSRKFWPLCLKRMYDQPSSF